MIGVNIRRQGGAAIMTIPSDVLRMLDVDVGGALEIKVSKGAFIARPISKAVHKRYSLAELLCGVSPEALSEINGLTAWAREGEPVGRELT